MSTTNAFGFSVDVPIAYEEADSRVRELLKAEGFGVLTEIDVRATMREKLDVAFPRYEILGACNPPLAHRALEADPDVGLLLPVQRGRRRARRGWIARVVHGPRRDPRPRSAIERWRRSRRTPPSAYAALPRHSRADHCLVGRVEL